MAKIIWIDDENMEESMLLVPNLEDYEKYELDGYYLVVSNDEETLYCITEHEDIAESVRALVNRQEDDIKGQERVNFGNTVRERLREKLTDEEYEKFMNTPVHLIKPVRGDRGQQELSPGFQKERITSRRISREEYEARDNVEAEYSLEDDIARDSYGD
ncbi:MAG: hypothetical protein CMB80_05560 [Flammeovirgaceae bacterium]|nr:hypothetical protein [Flammeovirgaceae bacterium]|tara:strand:+ start:12430 stop:12906 length:477 start_codon:yes stop_codon:yes gene_type:complete